MMRSIWTCLRHPRSWRECFALEDRSREIVQSWESEGKAAIQSAYDIKRQLEQQKRIWADDPITAAVTGWPVRRHPPPRAPQKGGD